MPLPIKTLDNNQEADKILQILRNIDSKASKALALDNHSIINFYYTLIRSAQVFIDLEAAGLTVEVLGPLLGDKLGINWADYQSDFLQLKNTDIPAFVSFVLTNQGEICSQSLGDANLTPVDISTSTKSSLAVLINNIKNLFEA